MANPTSNFGWQMPTPTDLVTDLPADFEVFGQAVDTSMADLKGGTSGQILAKNSNTDMDFVWIANDQGDITGITASSPLTGGGTSGAVTLGILSGTTSNLGAVQLSDSTSSTSTTLAATANAVKTTYDLANGAIPKSLIDAAGDLIVGTAADTAGRLGIGTAGQVLKVNSGATALEWGTASGGGTWTSWTPTWTNLTVGNGALTARYIKNGGLVNFSLVLVFGSTTSITGRVRVSWPVAPINTAAAQTAQVNVQFEEAGNAPWFAQFFNQGAGTSDYEILAMNTSGTYSYATVLSSTVPFTWGNGDYIFISGSYEVTP
jgi:hypothetical protein